MTFTVNRYKEDLENLIAISKTMTTDLFIITNEQERELTKKQTELKEKVGGSFNSKYQRWYTESYAVINQIIPHRVDEFEELYKGGGRRKEITALTFTIKDWLLGARSVLNIYTQEKPFNDIAVVAMRFRQQIEILKSAMAQFESSILDIKQILQADLFDSEIEVSRELLKHGYIRAAGVVSGVVLESHLSHVCAKHGIKSRKKNPTISDFNDLLKKESVIDIPQWRFVQRLGDLRNLCGHKKDRDPTHDDVEELINGTDKIVKTLF